MGIPTGPLVDVVATATGATIGALTGQYLPASLRNSLPKIFGLLSMSMGVWMIAKMSLLPAVVLAVLLGTIAGELLRIESRVEATAISFHQQLQRILPATSGTANSTGFLQQFVGILVLFSASGTGIFGAMNEGITHDSSLLLSKALLDFFTAVIFAASLGWIVAVIIIPQSLVLFSMYYLGGYILPHTTPALLADFSACGGVIMLATGLRICGIQSFAIVNMLPALLLVMPLSYWWRSWF